MESFLLVFQLKRCRFKRTVSTRKLKRSLNCIYIKNSQARLLFPILRNVRQALKTEPIPRNSAVLAQFWNFRTEESIIPDGARRLKRSDNLAECRNSGRSLVPFVVVTTVSSCSAVVTMRFALYLPIHLLFCQSFRLPTVHGQHPSSQRPS